MAASLNETLAQGVADGKIPHAVVFATNKDGRFTYGHSTGQLSYPDPEAIDEGAVFYLASQTKLLTSIAALQIVERGLWRLDEDVADKLPELAKLPILKGFDGDDKPILEKRRNAITLKHLLTHSAGTSYLPASAELTKFDEREPRREADNRTVLGRFSFPLVFEPGTSWVYGTGIDWAGMLVERVTGSTLEEYMKKNLFEPLGITSITFFPEKDPALKDRVTGVTVRTPDGRLAPRAEPTVPPGRLDCFGGDGAFASMPDYIKILRSILANDGRLLTPASVELMFAPQLSSASKQTLNDLLGTPFGARFIGEFKPDIELDFGFGGVLFMRDDAGRRKRGTLSWGGVANCFWEIDREADLALTFGTQVFPPGDPQVEEMITAAELSLNEQRKAIS